MQDNPIKSSEDIWRLAAQFMQSRVVLSAFELGLFSGLGDEGAGSSQIAQSLGLDARATDRLMNACAALGLLEKHDGIFRNTELTRQYLVKASPDYMGGLGHTVQLWNAWHTLSGAVKAGTQVRERDSSQEHTDSFIAAMHSRGTKSAPRAIEQLDLTGVARALDLGGGSGAYAMELCRAQDGLTATVLDTPEVIPLTKRYVNEAGLSGRVEFREGDFTQDEYGTGYDLIVLSSILHIYSPEENTKILERCARSLNPGGRAVIKEFVVNDERTGPRWPVMFALNMLVNTDAGDAYTQAEMFSWLKAAGFASQERIDIDEGTALLIGYKPK